MSKPSRGLKFCPVSNDLLYPRENKDLRRLEYYCKNCDYVQVGFLAPQQLLTCLKPGQPLLRPSSRSSLLGDNHLPFLLQCSAGEQHIYI